MNSTPKSPLSLRRRSSVLALAALLLTPLGSLRAEPTEERPNVIIFVADDLGWADPGFRGSGIENATRRAPSFSMYRSSPRTLHSTPPKTCRQNTPTSRTIARLRGANSPIHPAG